ncbi:MAG: hypothetical protein K5636_01210 [Bacteroidales bacterium]|nr:hypothetical protein [Bacteroidales bacterium]
MKKIALFAFVCLAMVFSSCNRGQQTYKTTMDYVFINPADGISTKAIVESINSYWLGDFTFNGDNADYTDVKALTKYDAAIAAIMLRNGDLKGYFSDTDCMIYNLYRTTETVPVLVKSTKFSLNSDGNLTTTELTD